MAIYGHARVSRSDQDFSLPKKALRAAGCDLVRAEKARGTGMQADEVDCRHICRQRENEPTVICNEPSQNRLRMRARLV